MLSLGPLSSSSIRSEKKRAQNPIVSTVMVKIPANGPKPTEITNINAQIKSGIVRIAETIDFVIIRTNGNGVIFAEQRIATGIEIITPTNVPTNAISKVSRIACKIGKVLDVSGGNALETKRPIFIIPLIILSNVISAFLTPDTIKTRTIRINNHSQMEGFFHLGGIMLWSRFFISFLSLPVELMVTPSNWMFSKQIRYIRFFRRITSCNFTVID